MAEDRCPWEVGMEVAIRQWSRTEYILPIARLTKTRFVVMIGSCEYAFWRESGGAVGGSIGSRMTATPATDKHREEIERRGLDQWLCRVTWTLLPTETMRQVKALVEQGKGEGDGNTA